MIRSCRMNRFWPRWSKRIPRLALFGADAEFAGVVDARRVRKCHAGPEDGFAAAHERGMLWAVESDAGAEAVGEDFVVRAVAAIDDDRARRIIDRAGEAAGARGVERG